MLVVMQHDATAEQVEHVVQVIEEMGYQARSMPGEQRTAVGLVGNDGRVDSSRIEALAGVAEVIHVTKPYKQVSREWQPQNTMVTIAPGVSFGGRDVAIIAGPCSVESEEQIVGSGFGSRRSGLGQQLHQGRAQPAAPGDDGGSDGTRGIQLRRSGVDERTTSVAVATRFDCETFDHASKHRRGILECLAVRINVVSCPIGPCRHVRGDEHVFGAVVLVERGLGDVRLGDDAVDADRVHALVVEEPVGRCEDFHLGRRRRAWSRGGLVGHPLVLSSGGISCFTTNSTSEIACKYTWVDKAVCPH